MARKITEAVIIGYGSMGKRHAGNLKKLGIKIAAIADPALEGLYEGSYISATSCLQDKARNRLVVIASPSYLHATHAIKALYAGAAAIYIEKPMTVNVPDAIEIEELAEDLNIPVTVGYNFRTHPGLHALIRNISYANCFFGAYGIDDPTTWPTYKKFGLDSYINAETGGVLWTSASHAIDMALSIQGPVNSVGASYTPEQGATVLRLIHSYGGVSTLYNKWMEGSPRTSILTYTSFEDSVVIDLLSPHNVDMHHTLMSNFLQYISNKSADLLVPSITEARHGIEVLVAAEKSISTKEQIYL